LGKTTGDQRSLYITQEIINKMEEGRKWKNINNEGGRWAEL
jgi:hypothetical protein